MLFYRQFDARVKYEFPDYLYRFKSILKLVETMTIYFVFVQFKNFVNKNHIFENKKVKVSSINNCL